MRFRTGKRENTPLLLVIAAVFTLGVILGVIAFFYVSPEIIEEAGESFSFDLLNSKKFSVLLKKNFLTETVWMLSIWIAGSISITTPLAAGVVAIRGFFMGFTVTFFVWAKERAWQLLISSILPQCIIALPAMSFFTIVCIKISLSKDKDIHGDTKYFLCGLFAVVMSLIAALAEYGIGKLIMWF